MINPAKLPLNLDAFSIYSALFLSGYLHLKMWGRNGFLTRPSSFPGAMCLLVL